MPRVLCVAEKPSIAKSVAQILSGGQFTTRNSPVRFIRNFDFTYPQTNSFFTVTAVAGHLTTKDFPDQYRNWTAFDPFILFDAPVETKVTKDAQAIKKNLVNEARTADTLMIWTDCDREGEHIGMEIVNVCRKVKPNIVVKRARFSAIIAQQIHNAAQHPIELDVAQADAVEARSELDLRLGAIFTRMQSMALRSSIGQLDGHLISYGPCQFPTLGFVVSQYEQVQSFSPEQFWYIYLAHARVQGEEPTHFNWGRGHIFDQEVVAAIHEHVLADPIARVAKIEKKTTKKWKPLPLTTVELQKAGSRLLKMSPKQVLDIAEALYQRGLVSYPRTETDQYDNQFDFMTLIGKQTASPEWGAFATSLQNGEFGVPRKGKKNDAAHPPIHPTNYAGNLNLQEKKVYDFITRRYLASCSKDAEGFETTVEVVCGGEEFRAKGLIILKRNYLDVYIYDKWTGNVLPDFVEGETFLPTINELRDGQTSPPSLLTEADLVTLMDKNGIGTDATIAQHIENVINREYVMIRKEGATKYLVPSTLGIGLVEGYNDIGFDKSLTKPFLRRDIERSLVRICERAKSKAVMLEESIEQYKEVFVKARQEFEKVVTSVRKYMEGVDEEVHADPPADGGGRGRGRGRGGGTGRGRGGRGGRGGGAGRGQQPPPDSDNDDVPPPPPAPRIRRGTSTAAAAQPAPSASDPALRAPLRTSNATSNVSTSDESSVMCGCSKSARKEIVRKESVNKGRQFWACVERKCEFFQWVDGSSNSDTRSTPAIPAKRSSSAAADQPERRCECDLTAKRLTVVKEGDNKGRVFWSCPNSQNARCKFFEWDDQASGSSKAGQGTQAMGVHTGACLKCGQEGHWASECTQVDGGNKRRKSGDNISLTQECFNCGGQGHWASACPRPSKGKSGGGGSSRSYSTSSSAECFNCGKPGHFSNACTKGKRRSSGGSGSYSSKRRGGRGGRGGGYGRGIGSKNYQVTAADLFC